MPSLQYKKEYCEKLIEHMSQGFSLSTFGGTVGVTRQTIYDWIERYPEFKEAKDIAFAKSQEFFEKRLIAKASGAEIKTKGFNKKEIDTACLIFALKTRFHKDYGDVSKHHIQQETVQINIDGDDSDL